MARAKRGTRRFATDADDEPRAPQKAVQTRSAPPRILILSLYAVTVTAGILAYANSFSGVFVYDDFASIPDNPHIRRLWPLWDVVSAPPQSTIAGRPIVSLSLALDYAIDGVNVRGYHAVNLAIHLLSALLLSSIVRRTLLNPVFGGRFLRAAPWLGAAVANIWMIHPLQTEAVTYIVQRTELLMGLFYLATLYCAIRGWSGNRRRAWFAAAVASCALGMASKESMASAPLVLFLYDRTFVSASFRETARRNGALHLSLAFTWLILGAILLSGPRNETIGLALGITPWSYLRTQAGVIAWYLRLALWPHPLVISYYDWPLASNIAAVWSQALLVMALLLATALALWRKATVGFLGAWFFLILAPTSSFVPIITEFAAERRMYLPLAAIVALAVIGVYRLLAAVSARLVLPPWIRAWMGGTSAVAVVTLLGCVTASRNRDYQSELALWSDTVAKRPANAMAHSDLGVALRQQGRVDEAIEQYKHALRLNPDFADAHFNMANALAAVASLDEAVTHYREALRLKPEHAEAHMNLGAALLKQDKPAEAAAHFTEALRLQPEDMAARYNLALALAAQGKLPEAIAQYVQVLRTSPERSDVHWGLALALVRQQRFDEAVREYREVLRIDPGNDQARAQLDAILRRKSPATRP